MINIKPWGKLNESTDWSFKTTVKETSIYKLMDGGEEVDAYGNSAEVEWSLEPEVRNDCVKGMNFTVTRVVCNINWTKGEDSEIDGETVFDSTAKEYAGWKIEDGVEFQKDGSLFIGSVEIDFKAKKVTVE